MQKIKISVANNQNEGDMDIRLYRADAVTAKKLATPRIISLSGEASGEGVFDGSADMSIYTTIERLTNEELERMLI